MDYTSLHGLYKFRFDRLTTPAFQFVRQIALEHTLTGRVYDYTVKSPGVLPVRVRLLIRAGRGLRMPLRKLPCLTPASLAARRANALKSTGPRTECGKARVALNALKHGRRAVALRERLARAGYRDGEALYCRIRERLSKTFARPGGPSGDQSGRHADRLANWIWVSQREWRRRESIRTKLECALESGTGTARLTKRTRIVTNCYPYTNSALPWPCTRINVHDHYRRIGLVFYAQWRRLETDQRCKAVLLGLEPFRLGNGELEDALRCRVYRLARPRLWERLRFCLDKQGRCHPEWEEEFRKVRARWRGTDMEIFLEPHPILESLRQKEQAGVSNVSSATVPD